MTRLAIAALAALSAAAPPSIELSVQSRTPRPGELVVLSIALAEAADHVRVHALTLDRM